jgi:transcriptional regulator with XRE-family HTH domain
LAGTSRPNVSAFEHGRRSPTLDTLERLLAANGQRLVAISVLDFEQHVDRRGKPFFVPNQLPQLSPAASRARVTLPKRVSWSGPQGKWDLADRSQRLLAYQLLLAEGDPVDISTFVDGTLLIDLWSEMFLPDEIRTAWQPLVDQVLG